jgi:hypothetical protein
MGRAQQLLQEEKDEVKHMNRIMRYAKCAAMREQQIQVGVGTFSHPLLLVCCVCVQLHALLVCSCLQRRLQPCISCRLQGSHQLQLLSCRTVVPYAMQAEILLVWKERLC